MLPSVVSGVIVSASPAVRKRRNIEVLMDFILLAAHEIECQFFTDLLGSDAAMKIALEFYRPRKANDAHAVVGRETADAADLDDAIGLARQLWRTLDMPQRPDAMCISDNEGNRLYSGTLTTAKKTG